MELLRLVSFGELMLGLFPPRSERLEQTAVLEITPACSELNTAVIVSRLGLECSFVTKVVNNELGRLLVRKVQEQGIDMANTIWTDEGRIGMMFADRGVNPHQVEIVYDRGGTPMQMLQPGEFSWESILHGAQVLHTSGITAGLSSSAAEATLEAVSVAKESNVMVSFDVNYRRALWSEDCARRILIPLLEYIDILFVTENDARRIFGIHSSCVETTVKELALRFDLDLVVMSLRMREGTSLLRGIRNGLVFCGGRIQRDRWRSFCSIGRLGSGDAFAGGFLFGYLTSGLEEAIRCANAASVLKQTNPGPLGWLVLEELKYGMGRE